MSPETPESEIRALIRPYTGEPAGIRRTARGFSPALRWRAEGERWIVLGFDVVAGRDAGFGPGSPDLASVVELVDSVGKLGLPEVAEGWPESRWNRFALDASEAELFQGRALLHTDINPSNLIVGSRGTWVVDWAWPTRGAGFIDPALLVVQLVSAGHGPGAAEAWASGCAAWGRADPKALDAFAAATVRMYRTFAGRRPGAAWLEAMVEAARFWAGRRGVTVV
ncbi:hypothetical protein OK074_2636 [Actinobacteria bacterium OK074]|nr:hypothetical protein OK074_2636 [Actinobacteria bacterium OK074]